MRSVAAVCLCVSAAILAAAIEGGAQQRPADPNDPRVGLKAGLTNAGEAARNMKKISSAIRACRRPRRIRLPRRRLP